MGSSLCFPVEVFLESAAAQQSRDTFSSPLMVSSVRPRAVCYSRRPSSRLHSQVRGRKTQTGVALDQFPFREAKGVKFVSRRKNSGFPLRGTSLRPDAPRQSGGWMEPCARQGEGGMEGGKKRTRNVRVSGCTGRNA